MNARRALMLLVASLAAVSGRELKQAESCSPAFGQCGGKTWTGSTCCVPGSVCTPQDDSYYSQCLPDPPTPPTPSPLAPLPLTPPNLAPSPSTPSPSAPLPSTPAPSTPSPYAPEAGGRAPGTALFNTTDSRLSEAEVASVFAAFDAWNAALQALDPEALADMYTEDAVLLPTHSNVVRITRTEIVDYCRQLLAKGPRAQLDEYNIRLQDVDAGGAPLEVSNAAVYTLTFNDGTSMQERSTFVYRLVAGVWKIHLQHSSQMPSKFAKSESEERDVYVNSADPTLSEAEVKGVLAAFDIWNAALASGDPHNVTALYAADALLLPTISDDLRVSQAERVDYFTKFLANKPQGVINEWNIRVEGVDALGLPLEVSNSGIYTFTFGATGEVAPARFTFVYAREGERWMIRHHHSSQMPLSGGP